MFTDSPILSLIIVFFYISGFLCAAAAILRSRTPQGATAWIVGLVTLPFVTVPLYMVFGRSKFYGYTTKRKVLDRKMNEKFQSMGAAIFSETAPHPELHQLMNSFLPLCRPGFTSGNKIKLLINGEETYSTMMKDIEEAKSYIIFQFYVIRTDGIGMKFIHLLMKRAQEGIRVNFLYDEIGTEIATDVIKLMQQAGVNVCHFNSFRGKGRFQINFRNHRKILVVDGRVGFIGGLNIGDDYLGLWPELGPWRDTHVRLEGPSVTVCQMTHAKDWFWCKHEDLIADWKIKESEGEANIFILPSGPADEKQACLLAHIAMINSAQKRLWIANPYLVPPEGLLNAILLAALRGVDVRVMIPSYSDAKLVMMASRVYTERLLEHKVRVFRYTAGFLHQKVMLVDDQYAVVGSANFDFRSMFINFEISVVAQEKKFVEEVEAMLMEDFKNSEEASLKEFEQMKLFHKITTRAANLLAPIL